MISPSEWTGAFGNRGEIVHEIELEFGIDHAGPAQDLIESRDRDVFNLGTGRLHRIERFPVDAANFAVLRRRAEQVPERPDSKALESARLQAIAIAPRNMAVAGACCRIPVVRADRCVEHRREIDDRSSERSTDVLGMR